MDAGLDGHGGEVVVGGAGRGYAAVEKPVSVHDFHATMLHLLGIDHLRMTVKFQGLDARLTGISGDVVKDILA